MIPASPLAEKPIHAVRDLARCAFSATATVFKSTGGTAGVNRPRKGYRSGRRMRTAAIVTAVLTAAALAGLLGTSST